MFHYDYKTQDTCSQLISLDLDGNVVHNVTFMGGCNGNLIAVCEAYEAGKQAS